MKLLAAVALVALALVLVLPKAPSPMIKLPAGVVELHREWRIGDGVEVRGDAAGTVVRAAADFEGRALIVVHGAGVKLRGFAIDGNRDQLERQAGLPPSDRPFWQFTWSNGVLAVGVERLTIEDVQFRNVAGFAVLVSASHGIRMDQLSVADSGSRNSRGRNNGTGGILLEEGCRDFAVTRSLFRNVRGNGLWTHSLFTSPRNQDGWFAYNRFEELARDAIQVGHATRVRVEENAGTKIGYPVELVDMESFAVPVAIDTAGDVDGTSYARNHFTEINGKCVDLDGFHDGEVVENSCVNRRELAEYPYGNVGILFNDSNPNVRSKGIRVVGNLLDGVKFSGIFAFGTGHTIARNRLLHLNLAHCNEEAARAGCYYPAGEPDGLQSGIYLGKGFLKPEPAHGIVVEDNEITGFKMDSRCVVTGPGIDPSANVVRGNRCSVQ